MNDDLRRRLSRIDLNLLPVLLVLMETGSTQATADRIGRTQSAVSHALNRLRDMLGDALFVRHGPRLVPTPLLLEMEAPLSAILHDAALLVERGRRFDPRTAERVVVIGCPDLALPLAEAICDGLARDAPNIQFRITGHRNGTTRLREGELDLLISLYRNTPDPGQRMSHVAAVDWAFYGAPGVISAAAPSAEDWARLPHVQVHTGAGGRTPIDDAARLAGVRRRVGLQVESFFEALFVASRGRMFFTTFPGLVRPIAARMGLEEHPLPFDVPSAPVCVITRDTKFEPLSQWVHEVAAATAERFFGGS